MYHLAGKLNLLNCFRCDEQILNIKDFTIDHKKEWLYNDKNLFWDINNIAFSHLSCNSAAARQPNKIEHPENMSWCSKCKIFYSLDSFYKQPPNTKDKTRNNLRRMCKKCSNKQRTKSRQRKRLSVAQLAEQSVWSGQAVGAEPTTQTMGQ